MSENGEGNQPGNDTAPLSLRKSWKRSGAEELNSKVTAMKNAGLPDSIIALQLGLTPGAIKAVSKRLGLPTMTATQSREAREKYLKEHPKPQESWHTFDPDEEL